RRPVVSPPPTRAAGRRHHNQRGAARPELRRSHRGRDGGGWTPRHPPRDHWHRLSHRHQPVPLRSRRSRARGIPLVRVLVLGGGIAGVTAAYFIARDGHEVTLLEEQDALGLDATAGNAGIIA